MAGAFNIFLKCFRDDNVLVKVLGPVRGRNANIGSYLNMFTSVTMAAVFETSHYVVSTLVAACPGGTVLTK